MPQGHIATRLLRLLLHGQRDTMNFSCALEKEAGPKCVYPGVCLRHNGALAVCIFSLLLRAENFYCDFFPRDLPSAILSGSGAAHHYSVSRVELLRTQLHRNTIIIIIIIKYYPVVLFWPLWRAFFSLSPDAFEVTFAGSSSVRVKRVNRQQTTHLHYGTRPTLSLRDGNCAVCTYELSLTLFATRWKVHYFYALILLQHRVI